MTERPKDLHHLKNVISSSFQTAIDSGKRVRRVTSDSIEGKQMMNTPGSILATDELLCKAQALKAKENRPNHGGAKEIARRLKQIKNYQHSIDTLSPTQRTMKVS